MTEEIQTTETSPYGDRLLDNQDGSSIYRLVTATRFKNEDHPRVTIPALKGKHLARLPFSVNGKDTTIGEMIAFASSVVQPVGIVEEMTPEDAIMVAHAVARALGKSQKTGG
jgi:hypothetical protein